MAFAWFKTASGKDVAVNGDSVRAIIAPGDGSSRCTFHFDGEHTLGVAASIEEAVERFTA